MFFFNFIAFKFCIMLSSIIYVFCFIFLNLKNNKNLNQTINTKKLQKQKNVPSFF